MISLTSIASVVGAFKSIKDAAESIISLRDETLIMGKVAEINAKLIDAQNGIFSINEERTTLVQTVGDLEKEIASMKAWDAEKQKYELVSLAPNVMAYSLKPSEHPVAPSHLLCANCYTDGKKRFLNQHLRGSHVDKYRCNGCGEELIIQKDDRSARPATSARRNPYRYES